VSVADSKQSKPVPPRGAAAKPLPQQPRQPVKVQKPPVVAPAKGKTKLEVLDNFKELLANLKETLKRKKRNNEIEIKYTYRESWTIKKEFLGPVQSQDWGPLN